MSEVAKESLYPPKGPCTCRAFAECGEHSITCPAWGTELGDE
jgi:hypothetical protein